MKSLQILCFIALTSCGTWGQGIRFSTAKFTDLVAMSKAANKPIFVEVYLNGCPHCQALEPILGKKEVGDFFNQNFVNSKIEANSELSKELQIAKKIKYPDFPQFLFFDGDGNLIHQASPSEMPTTPLFIEEVLKHGKDALDPKERTANYENRWLQGDREIGFLLKFGKNLKTINNSTRLDELNDFFNKNITTPADLESPVSFYILKTFIDDYHYPMAQYLFKNIKKFQSLHKADEVETAVGNIVHFTIFGSKADKNTAAEIVEMRNAVIAVGVPPQAVHGKTILKEIEALLRESQTQKAAARLSEYDQSYKLTIEDYTYFVRFFNDSAKDNMYVPSLINWAKKCQTLAQLPKNAPQLNDVYYELARAYKRVQNNPEAQKAIATSLKYATMAKADTKRHADFNK
jgi:thiol-disulfide isomerase/thioredoxin